MLSVATEKGRRAAFYIQTKTRQGGKLKNKIK